ncbi:MAG: DUF4124 domain-containing protein [Proteobacteria bacterium]|nr:DUF4124 domain-containing protein [Pseudomonadota bacterium]
MKSLTCWCLTVVGLISAASAQAEIYEWHGADGEVHYSDRKPGADVAAESINPRINHRVATPASVVPAAKEAAVEKISVNDDVAKAAEDAALFERNCEQANIRLASLRRPRINKLNADGTRSRMTEEWRQAQLVEANAAIEKYCQ